MRTLFCLVSAIIFGFFLSSAQADSKDLKAFKLALENNSFLFVNIYEDSHTDFTGGSSRIVFRKLDVQYTLTIFKYSKDGSLAGITLETQSKDPSLSMEPAILDSDPKEILEALKLIKAATEISKNVTVFKPTTLTEKKARMNVLKSVLPKRPKATR